MGYYSTSWICYPICSISLNIGLLSSTIRQLVPAPTAPPSTTACTHACAMNERGTLFCGMPNFHPYKVCLVSKATFQSLRLVNTQFHQVL